MTRAQLKLIHCNLLSPGDERCSSAGWPWLALSALCLARSPTWSFENQKDVRKRPSGPIQDPTKNAVSDPQGFLGISKAFGFTKQNEVFVGRVAMIGFAAAIVGEIQTGGKGPLGQLALPIQTPVNPGLAGFGLAVWIGFSLFTAIGLGNLGQAQGGEDIY
ncbi:hypothetical protein ABBQ38_012904 [Trebouxia sp. C0009 RCD-2024]